MKFVTEKIKWTDAMKEFSEDLIERKLKSLIDDYSKTSVKLTKLNNENLKVTLSLSGYRVQDVNSDFYEAMHEAVSKLKSIITKHKEKYSKSRYRQLSIFDQGQDLEVMSKVDDLISKEKLFELKPQTTEEALEELERTDYMFYVFKDIEENNTISIIYKRLNNTYGIIRCM